MYKILTILVIQFFLFSAMITAQQQNLRLQQTLDSLYTAGNFTGLSMAIVYGDNTVVALTAGYNDVTRRLK